MFSHLQGRSPLHLLVIWEDKYHYSRHLHFLLLPALDADYDSIWFGLPHWSQLCLLPTSCAPPAYSLLAWCKPFSAITKISLFFQYCFQHRSKTQPHSSYYEKDYLSQNRHRCCLKVRFQVLQDDSDVIAFSKMKHCVPCSVYIDIDIWKKPTKFSHAREVAATAAETKP